MAKGARTLRTLILGGVGFLFVTFSGVSRAESTDTICSGSGHLSIALESSHISAATDRADVLRSRSTELSAPALLSAMDISENGTGSADPMVLAQYCYLAGRIARSAQGGTQNQASRYLVAAYRYADRAKAEPLAAKIAFEFALTRLYGATKTNGRGAPIAIFRGAVARGSAAPAPASAKPHSNCDIIGDGQALLDGGEVALAALDCAAKRGAARDPVLAAVAMLRAGRLALARYGTETDEPVDGLLHYVFDIGEMRHVSGRACRIAQPPSGTTERTCADEGWLGQARLAAVRGLGFAERVEVPEQRAELAARLIDLALDIDPQFATDPATLSAVAALRATEPSGPGAAALVAGTDAQLALLANNKMAAAAAARRALTFEAQRATPSRLPRWFLLLALAEPERRTEHVRSAYQWLETLRPVTPMFDPLTEESSFATDMRQVFKAAIDTELQSTSGDDIARIDTAQHILETYREAELQSVFGDGCVPSRPGVTIATLSPNEIVLYPIILPDRIELLYARGGMAGFRRLPAQPMRERAVRALVANVVSMSVYEGDEWKPSAAKLYELLVQPIENLFGDGATLVIVPDAALRPLPFAALIDARGRYLVERTRISVAPALAYSDPGEAGDGGQNARVVAAAIEHNVTLPMGLFQALAATGAEARIAAGIADSSRTRGRVIENFGKGDLVRTIEAGGFDVLHLATHASFNGRSDQSFIVTSDAPMMLSELRTAISTGRTRGDRIDLLVLSACETAVGDDSASMGLAGVAVEAGANSVIASLWQVNDIGTGQLMRAFYGAYRGGAGRADALRTAQLEMIRSGGQNSDPYIWSAFTLLGSWR